MEYVLSLPAPVARDLLRAGKAGEAAARRADPQSLQTAIDVVGLVADSLEIVVSSATIGLACRQLIRWARESLNPRGGPRSEAPLLEIHVRLASGSTTSVTLDIADEDQATRHLVLEVENAANLR
jgi:hypothetical protein